MNEKILSEILSKVSTLPKNDYGTDITQDLFEVTKNELNELEIKFEPYIYKQKERLKIFYTKDDYFKYSKNFYNNNSMFGFKISNDKMLTEKFLKLANVPTTNSIKLSANQFEKGMEYLVDNPSPKVVKPINLANGRGVFVDVTTDNFREVWEQCVSIQKQRKVKYPKVLIQDMVTGFEVRVIVVEGKVLSATLRTPPYVIGDGNNTIADLINEKNKIRSSNEYFRNKDLKQDEKVIDYLSSKQQNLDTVLKENELCITYPISNLVNGGENIVVTHLLNDKILKTAQDAAIAIPGIHTAGVDVLIDSLETDTPTILEINKAPALQLNYYPYIGEPQSPLKYIFSSLVLEQKIINNQLDINNLNEFEFNILINRYKYLFRKQKTLSTIIGNIKN